MQGSLRHLAALVVAGAMLACAETAAPRRPATATATATATAADDESHRRFAALREAMVARQLRARDVTDARVLQAMERVPRHLFVPADLRDHAYGDHPLPIGLEQTISQPYIVAFMTQALEVEAQDRVLEVGTGSGYQAAVLGELASEVFSIEILPALADHAREALIEQDYRNVTVRAGDGYFGWPENAPFDGIMVTAAPDHVPPALVDQLAVGAHLVMPVGDDYQELVRITRQADGTTLERLLPVRFVPMTGRAQEGR